MLLCQSWIMESETLIYWDCWIYLCTLKYLFKASFFSDSYFQHYYLNRLYINLLVEKLYLYVKSDIEPPI